MRRAAWLILAICGGCASVPLSPELPAPQPPPTLAVDLHLHVTIDRAAKPLVRGEPGSGPLAHAGSTRLFNQITEAGLRASGVRLVVASLWPPYNLRPGRTALDEVLHQLDELRAFTRLQPGFLVTTSAAQARTALAEGRVALLPSIEGGEGLHSVEDLDQIWAAGARSVTLVHFVSSQLGGAANGQPAHNLLGITLETPEPLGLTPLGRQVVERMMALGMVIDLAHSSDAMTAEVLALTGARGVPVINSHSPARAFKPMERSITDAQAAAIARGGGLIGVTVFNGMLSDVPESARFSGFVPRSCDEVVAHWLQLAKAAGADALALGSDFNGFITRHGPGGSCPEGLPTVEQLPALFASLEAHGVPRASLDGMGERFLRLWEKVEAKADPKAQAEARRSRRVRTDLFDAP